VSGESKAVFLSYASEDSQPVQRIADALRAAGIEVWFDKNELRGADAWDRKIRQQIRDCGRGISNARRMPHLHTSRPNVRHLLHSRAPMHIAPRSIRRLTFWNSHTRGHEAQLTWIKNDVLLAGLAREPRFEALLSKMNLPR